MKYTLFIFFYFIICLQLYAHDSNQAHFKIEIQENCVVVITEFPWTIRKALLDFAPELKNSNDKDLFQTAFFNYINSTLILSDSEGNQIKLVSVKEMKNDGHSHQTNFKFTFEQSDIYRIKNFILFNVNAEQTNFHSIVKNQAEYEFITTNIDPEFILSNKITSNSGRNFLWLLVLISVPLYVWRYKNQSN